MLDFNMLCDLQMRFQQRNNIVHQIDMIRESINIVINKYTYEQFIYNHITCITTSIYVYFISFIRFRYLFKTLIVLYTSISQASIMYSVSLKVTVL